MNSTCHNVRAINHTHTHTIGARPELGVHVIISQDHGKDVDLASEGEQEGRGFRGQGPTVDFTGSNRSSFKKCVTKQ
jgi:hypothetical protein